MDSTFLPKLASDNVDGRHIRMVPPLIAASVTFSQPRSLCALALDFSTVRQALSRRTPWSAHPEVAEFVNIDEDKRFSMISMFPNKCDLYRAIRLH